MAKQQECPGNKAHRLNKEVRTNEEEKYPKVESDRKSQEVREGRLPATEDSYEHFLHDGENLCSMEEIRRRYNKLIEEGKFRVWEAENPMFKIQQSLLERR